MDSRERHAAWKRAWRAKRKAQGLPSQYRCTAATTARRRRIRRTNAQRARAILSRYKRLCGCADCGYREYACALDFDHRDPEAKLWTVGERLSYKWERVKAEVRKCDVVCANCHRVRTHASSSS
jgi:hypothetical protein